MVCGGGTTGILFHDQMRRPNSAKQDIALILQPFSRCFSHGMKPGGAGSSICLSTEYLTHHMLTSCDGKLVVL